MYGMALEPRVSKTAGTPSYPSGHAFQSRLAAEVLASYAPNDADKFRALADKIADSRMWLGVHFPSDIEYGKYLAQSVAPEVVANLRYR
jgi:acid phosphatase (class A)